MPETVLPADSIPREIRTDLSCAKCQYNLRGLTTDARCPECGAPVERSLHGNLLRFADLDWVKRLHLGVRLKLWNVLFSTVLLGGGAAAAIALGAPLSVAVFLGMVAGLLGLSAVWLITSPEPTIGVEEDPIALRKVIRLCAVLGLVGGQAPNVASIAGGLYWLVILAAILSLVGLVAAMGEFVYLRRFARRIPDPKLEKTTGTVMWGFVIVYGVAGLAGGIGAGLGMFGMRGPPAANPGFGTSGGLLILAGCVFGVGSLIVGLAYVVLIMRYQRAFKAVVAEAKLLTGGNSAGAGPPTLR